MNFGQAGNLLWVIFISGDVQLRLDLIGLTKRNWTPKQLAVTLLVIRNDLGAISSMIPHQGQSSKRDVLNSLKMSSLRGEIRIGTLLLRRSLSRLPLLLLTICQFIFLSLIKKWIRILKTMFNNSLNRFRKSFLKNKLNSFKRRKSHYGDPLERGEEPFRMTMRSFSRNMRITVD